MTRIYMVRHGHAAAAWGEDLDPGLSDNGHAQAKVAARTLQQVDLAQLLTSPLKRAQETAAPLANLLGKTVSVEPRVAEIPSPGMQLEERGPWLRGVMQSDWSSLSAELQDWRNTLVACLKEIESPPRAVRC